MALIRILNRALAAGLAVDLTRLDQMMLAQSGRDYTDEAWDERHFLMDVPGKWDHSAVALGPGSSLLGFIVASRSAHPAVGVYLHRVAVDPEVRGRGVGRELLQAVLDQAVRQGASRVTMSISVRNQGAARFYARLGFRRLDGPELAEIVRLREMPSQVLGDSIQEATGHRKYLLGLDLPPSAEKPPV